MKFHDIFSFCFSRAEIFIFFHAHIFRFHGWDLAESFTGTVYFSRAVSKKFIFSRAEIQKFSREGFFFSREKKNTDQAPSFFSSHFYN